jgi:hypothetical protein
MAEPLCGTEESPAIPLFFKEESLKHTGHGSIEAMQAGF